MDNAECSQQPQTKMIKVENSHTNSSKTSRVLITVPIMLEQLHHNIATYTLWSMSGFDIILVCAKDEEEMVTNIVQQHKNHSIKVISFDILYPNAGIAKNFAYRILTGFLD